MTTMLVGRRIGDYEIVGVLGSGGMGHVYRAQDVKLGREVALTVITPEGVNDADDLCRFTDEARCASSLNHPSIVTIYGVGEEDGIAFIAMECVKGRTVREYSP